MCFYNFGLKVFDCHVRLMPFGPKDFADQILIFT